MSTISRFSAVAGAVVVLTTAFTVAPKSQAATIVLDFEGVGNGAQVLDFYNGGTDSAGNSGTNYGINFSADARAFTFLDYGGNGNFGGEQTTNTALFYPGSNSPQ
jgi:hypothetical protein